MRHDTLHQNPPPGSYVYYGHRQVTDATLVATAIAYDGVPATLDPGILALLPSEFADRVRLIHP